jgi:hypothetical protein
MDEWVWSNGGMILTGINWSTGTKTHLSASASASASLVRGQEVTPEPWNDINLINVKNTFIEPYLIFSMNACPFLMNASFLLYTEFAALCVKGEKSFAFQILFYFVLFIFI